MTRIKRSHLAGTWYPDDPAALREEIDGWLRAADSAALGGRPVVGLVVPHAGYRYSGRAAAAGYACLAGAAYARVVILAPSHYGAFRGVALLDVDAFETPLGRIRVAHDAVAALAAAPLCAVNPEPYRAEHALEIQLPLLQRVLPDVSVVPALVGHLAGHDYAAVATAFDALATPDTLFIVSSDFVHYGWRFEYLPFPADDAAAVRDGLRALDMGAIERVCDGDAESFQHYVAETGATICGRMPIALFLTLHRRRSAGRLLMYYTSLDVTGDYEHSVSYASIVFPRPA